MSKSKKLLGNLKNRLEKTYNNLLNDFSSNKTVIYLENEHFQNGTIIIDSDWFLWTNNGISEKIQGSTNGYIFKLKEGSYISG